MLMTGFHLSLALNLLKHMRYFIHTSHMPCLSKYALLNNKKCKYIIIQTHALNIIITFITLAKHADKIQKTATN